MTGSRWAEALALFDRGRPGSAFDHLLATEMEALPPADFRDAIVFGASLVAKMPPGCMGSTRKGRLAAWARHFAEPVEPRAAERLPGRASFPVAVAGRPAEGTVLSLDISIAHPSLAGDVITGRDRLDADALRAIGEALDEVRKLLQVTSSFIVALPDSDIVGGSLGLAAAIAATAAVNGWRIDERWVFTGRVRPGGTVDDVALIPEKRALLSHERPGGWVLSPLGSEQRDAEPPWVAVGSLNDAIAEVFAADFAATESQYLTIFERQVRFIDHRRFAGDGVESAGLASRDLDDAYVVPDLLTVDWVKQGATRAQELYRALESAELAPDEREASAKEYHELTGQPFRQGVPPEPPRLPLSDEIASHRRLVVCGDLGMGKTTLLQRLGLTALRESRTAAGSASPPSVPIPVRVSLVHFPRADRPSLGAFLSEQLAGLWTDLQPLERAALDHALRRRIESGSVLLLLDGLNERPDARAAIIEAIDGYLDTHPAARMVLTSRAWAYDRPLRGEIPIRYLAPFTDRQRREFVARNLQGAADGGVARGETVLAMLERNAALRELGGNPFFVTLAALLAEAELASVRHRVQLYEAAFEKLWRGRLDDAIEWRRDLWACVAAGQLRDRRLSEHRRHWIERIASAVRDVGPGDLSDPRALLEEAIEPAGIVAKTGSGELRFFHQSFGEYLAAVHLTRSPLAEVPTRVQALLPRRDAGETLRLTVGRLAHVFRDEERVRRLLLDVSDPDRPVEALDESGILFAWSAAEDGVPLPRAEVALLAARLARHVRELPRTETLNDFLHAMYRVTRVAERIPTGPLLDELLLLADAPHPVPALARHVALERVAAVADRDARARTACEHIWERERDARNPPAAAAVGMVLGGAILDQSMLTALREAAGREWLERLGACLAARRTEAAGALGTLTQDADEAKAWAARELLLLASPDPKIAAAVVSRQLEKSDAGTARILAHAASGSAPVLATILAPAAASDSNASALGHAVGKHLRGAAAEAQVTEWLLQAPAKTAVAWIRSLWPAHYDQHDAMTPIRERLTSALSGAASTASRAALLLRVSTSSNGQLEALKSSIRARISSWIEEIDAARGLELLEALRDLGGAEERVALLARLLARAGGGQCVEIIRTMDRDNQNERSLLERRLERAVTEMDYAVILGAARELIWTGSRGSAISALRRVGASAPSEVQSEAGELLVHAGSADEFVVGLLLRGSRGPDASESMRSSRDHALREAIRRLPSCSPTLFRLMLDVLVVDGGRESWRVSDLLAPVVERNEDLFEIVIDEFLRVEAPPAVEKLVVLIGSLATSERRECAGRLALRLDARLGLHADHDRRILDELAVWFPRRPQFVTALRAAVDQANADPHHALDAAGLLVSWGRNAGAGLDADAERVLRGLLAHDEFGVVYRAATILVQSGRTDAEVVRGVRTGLRGSPPLRFRAALLLHGLGAWDDEAKVALLGCLGDATRVLQHGYVELILSNRHWDDRVDLAAAQLLTAYKTPELIPVLVDWAIGEDAERAREAEILLSLLGRANEPAVVAAKVRAVREGQWYEAEAASDWLWEHVPECLDHADALVDRWRRSDPFLRDHFTNRLIRLLDLGSGMRPDPAPPRNPSLEKLLGHAVDTAAWRRRMEDLIATSPPQEAARLSTALIARGCTTERLAALNVEAVVACGRQMPWPVAVRLLEVMPTQRVLEAAWSHRLQRGSPTERANAANVFLHDCGPGPYPDGLKTAMLDAYRTVLRDEDISLRVDAAIAFEWLAPEDGIAADTFASVITEQFGDGSVRLLYGDLMDAMNWGIASLNTKLLAAERMINLGLSDPRMETFLLNVIGRRATMSNVFVQACQLLARIRGHAAAVRAAIADREVPLEDALYHHQIIEVAVKVGVDPGLLLRRAVLAILSQGTGDSWAVPYIFGSEKADALNRESFVVGRHPWERPSRHASDPTERAAFWTVQMVDAAQERPALVEFLVVEAGGSPPLARRLASAPPPTDIRPLQDDLSGLVRRRPGDDAVKECARGFLREWIRRLS